AAPVRQAGREHQVVELPDVAPVAVGRVALEEQPATLAPEAHPFPDDTRAGVPPRRRELPGPQVARLEDVVVDRDHPRKFAHRSASGANGHPSWTAALTKATLHKAIAPRGEPWRRARR